MAHDGAGVHDGVSGMAHSLPGSLSPEQRAALARRSAPLGARFSPPRDPLGPRRRRWMRRLIGWLARQLDAAADTGHGASVADRHYAGLLRRLEDEMLLRERASEADEREASVLDHAAGQGPGDAGRSRPKRSARPVLRIVK